jgi:hypothetical protein
MVMMPESAAPILSDIYKYGCCRAWVLLDRTAANEFVDFV